MKVTITQRSTRHEPGCYGGLYGKERKDSFVLGIHQDELNVELEFSIFYLDDVERSIKEAFSFLRQEIEIIKKNKEKKKTKA